MTSLRRLLFHNLLWKLGSLGLALALWYWLVGVPEQVTVEAAGVYYTNLRSDLAMNSIPPTSVEIQIKGSSAVLTRQSLTGVKVLLDLARVNSPGRQNFAITANDVRLPEGVTFLSAHPQGLTISFDRRATRKVPVHVEISGKPADGFEVAQVVANPPEVQVSGPEGKLNQLDVAQTDMLDVSGLKSTARMPVGVFVMDPLLQIDSNPSVVATVTIQPLPADLSTVEP